LGGTFDPIHQGHLLLAEIARDRLKLDCVHFVPAGDPPHKRNIKKSAAWHRQKMVELAINGNPHFELNPVDLDRPGPHYSTDTIKLIRSHYRVSADNCFFIIGGDSLADLAGWHQPHKLIMLCRLAVIHRPGFRPDTHDLAGQLPGLETRLNWIATPAIDLAASQIRSRVAAGQSIRYQVPEAVRIYIRQHSLYL